MGWVIIAIIAMIVGLIKDLAPFLLILALIGVIYFCYRGIKSKLQEREYERVRKVSKRVEEIITGNTPKESLTLSLPRRITVTDDIVNKDVIAIVRKHKQSLYNQISERKVIDKQLRCFLKCNGYSNVDDKNNYLEAHIDEIKELKRKSDVLYGEINERKIQLLNEDSELMLEMKKSFRSFSFEQKMLL